MPFHLPHNQRFRATSGALAFALLTLLVAGCETTPKVPPPAITLASSTEPDGIHITQSGSNVLIVVQSARGIGNAWFEVAKKPPVREVRLRLHLRGLEEFRFSQGGSELRVSVPSQPGQPVHESVQRAGQFAQALAPADPLWIPVQIVQADGAVKAIPLQSGWFELTLPALIPFGDGNDFRLSWVDFFR